MIAKSSVNKFYQTSATNPSIHKQEFEIATQKLIDLIGIENVKIDLDTRLYYGRSTLANGTTPSAIVKPISSSEVQSIVTLANQYKLPIHPISTGKNWGYSDACAVQNGQILVDLSRMNKIIEVNEKLGFITLEPGVTQGQVYDFLEINNIKLSSRNG